MVEEFLFCEGMSRYLGGMRVLINSVEFRILSIAGEVQAYLAAHVQVSIHKLRPLVPHSPLGCCMHYPYCVWHCPCETLEPITNRNVLWVPLQLHCYCPVVSVCHCVCVCVYGALRTTNHINIAENAPVQRHLRYPESNETRVWNQEF